MAVPEAQCSTQGSPLTSGAHSRVLPYLAHQCCSGFGVAPDWPGSVDYTEGGARVPISGPTSQAGYPSLMDFSTLLCIPWGGHMAFCGVGGPRTCGWGKSCDKYNQQLCVFASLSFPYVDVIVEMKYIQMNTKTKDVCKEVSTEMFSNRKKMGRT